MQMLSIGEAAELLGVAVSTLRRWEIEGRLIPSYRTQGGHRRYSLALLYSLLNPALTMKIRLLVENKNWLKMY